MTCMSCVYRMELLVMLMPPLTKLSNRLFWLKDIRLGLWPSTASLSFLKEVVPITQVAHLASGPQ